MATRDIGVYVPTTDIFDVTDIQQLDVNSSEFKELIVRLQQRTNQIALALNQKETAMYSTNEFLTSQLFFPNPAFDSTTGQPPDYRQAYRILVIFGALPNAGVKFVPHNIPADATYTFTRIWGVANDLGSGIRLPLPASSPILTSNIALFADNINVYVVTGDDFSSYTDTNIMLEYFIG